MSTPVQLSLFESEPQTPAAQSPPPGGYPGVDRKFTAGHETIPGNCLICGAGFCEKKTVLPDMIEDVFCPECKRVHRWSNREAFGGWMMILSYDPDNPINQIMHWNSKKKK